MIDGGLLAFVAASVLITIVPGADMALLARQVFAGGTGLAYRTIAGNLSGLVVHGAAAAEAQARPRGGSAFVPGFVSTVLNPKPALFGSLPEGVTGTGDRGRARSLALRA